MHLNLKTINMVSIIEELLPKRGIFNGVFDNGEIVAMPVRKLIFHLIFWNVCRKWGVDIDNTFIVDTSVVNSNTITNIGTKILDMIRTIHPTYHDLVYDLSDAINTLNKFVINNCQEYHKSLSILDLVRIAAIPEIKKICDDKISDINLPIKVINGKIKSNVEKLFKELKKPHPDNTIYDFINLRFVNEVQLAHIFYQIGFRTDINDQVVRYPVQGNYLDGLHNGIEYCLEALSAKKSAFYNRDSLPTTEYFGRKQHILLSGIKYMYPGDCGTTITMPMLITERLRDVVLYKNIVEGAQLITLTKDNIDKYVGKVVDFRTPMTCRYQNGICEACGGKLLASITPQTHVGIFSAIQTTAVVTQVILSAKHMQDTSTVDYIIPGELKTMFVRQHGGIYVIPKIAEKFKSATLVLSVNDAVHLLCLSDYNLNRLSSINESAFGMCREIVVLKDNIPVSNQICLEQNGQAPMYSRHLIKYIADNPQHTITRDEMFMVDLVDFNFVNPLFKLTVMNDSMVKFVDNAKKLLETKIQTYKSITQLVTDFTNLVYSQVKPNITYLEVVLRAAMISGKYDYRIPIVTDIDNVKFTANKTVNMRRSLGMLCAFEQLPTAFEDPAIFIMPKSYVAFDDFLNLKPAKRNKPSIPITVSTV